MAIPIRLILFICVIELVSGQFPQVNVEGLQSQRSTAGPRLTGRFIPRPNAKSGNLQGTSKIRRPIPLRTRPVSSDSPEASPLIPHNARPVFIAPPRELSTQPPQALQQDQPVKPVSEEHEDEREDVAQAIANLGAVSHPQPSGPQLSNFYPLQSTPRPEQQIVQFRPHRPAIHHQPEQLRQNRPPTHQPPEEQLPQLRQNRPPTHHAPEEQLPQLRQNRPPTHQPPEEQLPQLRQNRPPTHQNQPVHEQNVPPIQYRQQKPVKLRKPVIEEIPEVRIPIKPKQLETYKKHPNAEYRGKKPVAQIIRRWREDNPDGSITWGFENDDGSYKEEVIGIDCITRGKYGYVDPDGIRREYTYETGIKCDEEQQQDTEDNGFVDYTENKLVLPNGRTIDLSSMGKKQSRRPGPIYRN